MYCLVLLEVTNEGQNPQNTVVISFSDDKTVFVCTWFYELMVDSASVDGYEIMEKLIRITATTGQKVGKNSNVSNYYTPCRISFPIPIQLYTR